MLGSELFVEFYRETHHGQSAMYLFFGLEGKHALVPWIWTSIAMNVAAAAMLSVHRLRETPKWLYTACGLLFVGILVEKGIGTIIPGFIPEPWGGVDEYVPTWVELCVSLGIWAMGAFVFTLLAKAAVPVETGARRYEQ